MAKICVACQTYVKVRDGVTKMWPNPKKLRSATRILVCPMYNLWASMRCFLTIDYRVIRWLLHSQLCVILCLMILEVS